MKEHTNNHVSQNPSESDEEPAEATSAVWGQFVTETFKYDGERQVTVYVPPEAPEAIVYFGT